MAVLTVTNRNQTGAYAVTANTLTASDTFTYTTGINQQLLLENTTGSPVTVDILGNGATSFTVPGYGNVSVAAGLSVTVAANSKQAIQLDSVAKYLAGTSVGITGGVGLTAVLFN